MISLSSFGTNAAWLFRRLKRSPITFRGVDSRWIPWSGIGVAVMLVIFMLIIAIMILLDDDLILIARDAPAWLGQFFAATTDFGKSVWGLSITAVGLLLIALVDWRNLPKHQGIRARAVASDLAFAFYNIAITGALASLIKNLIGRGRPKFFDEQGHLAFNPAEFDASWASFPSGHSTTFGCIAMLLYLRFPKWWPLWLAFGVAGGASRVLVDAHYPSDAIAGVLFGAMLTWLSARWLAQRGLMFTFRTTSTIPKRRLPVSYVERS